MPAVRAPKGGAWQAGGQGDAMRLERLEAYRKAQAYGEEAQLLRQMPIAMRQARLAAERREPWVPLEDAREAALFALITVIKQNPGASDEQIERLSKPLITRAVEDLARELRDRAREGGEWPGAQAPGSEADLSDAQFWGILDSGDPANRLERAELEQLLEKAVEELPEDERLALSLTEEQGLTLQEAAEAMGISKGAASRLRSKAIARLRSALAKHW